MTKNYIYNRSINLLLSVFTMDKFKCSPIQTTEVYSTIAVSLMERTFTVYTPKTNTITFQSTYHYTTSHDYGAHMASIQRS